VDVDCRLRNKADVVTSSVAGHPNNFSALPCIPEASARDVRPIPNAERELARRRTSRVAPPPSAV